MDKKTIKVDVWWSPMLAGEGDQRNFTYCWVIACKLHRDLMMEYIERAFAMWE